MAKAQAKTRAPGKAPVDKSSQGEAATAGDPTPAAGADAAGASTAETASPAAAVAPSNSGAAGTLSTDNPRAKSQGAGNVAGPHTGDAEEFVRSEFARIVADIRQRAASGDHASALAAVEAQLVRVGATVALMAEGEALFRAELAKLAPSRLVIMDAELPAPEGTVRVMVSGPKQGRYRIGRHFAADAVTIPVTADELLALQADPALAVTPA